MTVANYSPKISLVTPSFNQGAYLEATLLSVLNQDYPALEYVVVDGGSTDDSVELIKKHSKGLAWWASEKDGGQYDAINKGFSKTNGEIMGWLNSDDMLTPWALSLVGEIFGTFREIKWLTTRFPLRWDARGRAVACTDVRGFSRKGMLRGENLPGGGGFGTWPIQQESTFWRRSLWEESGAHLDDKLDAAADFDLWMRFAKFADPVSLSVPLGGFRRHGDQKTSRDIEHYTRQAREAFEKQGGKQGGTGYSTVRNICRDRLPAVLHPLAASFGLLHEAIVCSRSRDNSAWQLKKVLI